jgi:hypothetical protein
MRIPLLGLMVEQQHGLPSHVQARVIVIAQLGCGDPEPCEDDRRVQIDSATGIREENRARGKGLLHVAVRHADRRPLAIQLNGHDIELLQIPRSGAGPQPDLAHLGRNEPDGGFRATRQRRAPLEGRGRQEVEIGPHALRIDLVEAGNRGRKQQNDDGEQECFHCRGLVDSMETPMTVPA